MILGTYCSKVIDGSTNVQKRRSRNLQGGRSGHTRSSASDQMNAKAECYARE